MKREMVGIILCVSLTYSCGTQEYNKLSDFQIEQDFTLEMVATEPLIQDPVDLEYNEMGDALVLEMPGYPLEDKQSRIKILKDTNQDGVYDEEILFAENLAMASSIMPYKKGVLVAAPPFLLHLKDDDQNYQVDAIDTLMGGFSTGNLQHNYNGLTLGLDGWIYAANGGNSGKPFWWGDTTSVIDLRGRDLRINLERKVMERIGRSSGGFGLAMDNYGRLFETHNLKHISHLVFQERYLSSEKLLIENTLSNVSDHEENGLARIYPIGEQESRVNHPEQSGYFSSSCGITFYGGGAFGPEYENTVWVADVVLNLIHADKISPSGASFNASRMLQQRDFLASKDRSFRPVNLTVGPDGALYVVDMYRQVIEHPEWIPDEIEMTLDLNAGKDKGRIYRITRLGLKSEPFNTEKLKSAAGCIESLSNPNQWIRKTAHRILCDMNLSPEEIDLLANSLKSENENVRLHAMWVLRTKGELKEAQLISLLKDSSPSIRENALVATEAQIASSENLVKPMIELFQDENQRVRMQAGLTMSVLDDSLLKKHWDSIREAIVKQGSLATDEWNIASLTLVSKDHPAEVFQSLMAVSENQRSARLMESLASVGGAKTDDIQKFLEVLASSSLAAADRANIVRQLGKGKANGSGKSLLTPIRKLEGGGDVAVITALNELRKKFQLPASAEFLNLSKVALSKVLDVSLSENARLEQLALLASLPYADKSNVLFQALNNTQPLAIQEEALKQLSTYKEIEIGKKIVSIWKQLGPQTRRLASNLLLYVKIHNDALLTGLENRTINIGEMNFDLERRRTLLWWSDNDDIKRRAEKLFSDVEVVTRQEAINKMKDALTLTGSSKKGAKVFENICSNCHVFGRSGKDVGPVLTEISRKSKETLLHDILDPNAATDTKYINHRLETNQGVIHQGIVKNETDHSITIMKMGGESVTIQKSDIKEFNSLGTSLMMEGLEGSITSQEMADLLAYLQNLNQ